MVFGNYNTLKTHQNQIKGYLLLLSLPLFEASKNMRMYMYPSINIGNTQQKTDIAANQQRTE